MKELPPLHGTYYRVVDWDGTFENAASRELKKLSWVGVPVGLLAVRPFRYLARMDDPEAAWGVFAAVVLASSQTPIPNRGLLMDMHGPVSAEDFAVHTGWSVEVVQTAFDALCTVVRTASSAT